MIEACRVRLLVEGVDDYHVTIQLLNEYKVNAFNVMDCKGYSRVAEQFKPELGF